MAEKKDDGSELEEGVKRLGAAVETLAGRLFGEKLLGRPVPPDKVAISPQADEAIARAGADVGRFLHAAGEGLKAHPLRPDEALRAAKAAEPPPPPPEGLTELSSGILNLGGGVFKVAEGVLDKVAPRKPKAPPEEEE